MDQQSTARNANRRTQVVRSSSQASSLPSRAPAEGMVWIPSGTFRLNAVHPTSHSSEDIGATQIRVDDAALSRLIAMESDAICIATPTQVQHDVTEGRLVALAFELPGVNTAYGIIQLAGRTPSPIAAAFIEALRTVEGDVSQHGSLPERPNRNAAGKPKAAGEANNGIASDSGARGCQPK